MRVIRYENEKGIPVLAALTEQSEVYNLSYKDFMEVVEYAQNTNQTPLSLLQEVIKEEQPEMLKVEELTLLAPIEAPEVWAAGVTYERSKEARNYEATAGKLDATTFYDKVYDAERPELFMKSTAARLVGPNTEVYIRSDSTWQIPEPELGLVINKNGDILAYTIGNDMSSRDIEGENPLYLPQAKIWKHSCSIGPALLLADAVQDPYQLDIHCRIFRNGQKVVEGFANTNQLKRKYEELVSYLLRDNEIFDGTVLLTGTCIVPPNEFTLLDGDLIEIEIPGIGVLSNPVKAPVNKHAALY
ncbi:2-dehydro-3-deoxy-D-arabinonate dehydratase [Bacillus sp. SLBN-46]|jgi:2-dehydro-3-deoxy-D-arabinonate dehydratase|uniref:fumarylacetoacetate hydrolase family protein n=1 Tax=Bacillus sp. SLBN-46 TaxID=3042283 RepID=UPI00286494A2|nr:fumarylacetoacetate hydrolase family protein [Bacillus sp. SLBN-46]MDR6121327.1 2-dehydro-3-deoxy-D-arabinonate dehydratase [Bacillus sp. SLBN-46]